jgi:hypothetical protein
MRPGDCKRTLDLAAVPESLHYVDRVLSEREADIF